MSAPALPVSESRDERKPLAGWGGHLKQSKPLSGSKIDSARRQCRSFGTSTRARARTRKLLMLKSVAKICERMQGPLSR